MKGFPNQIADFGKLAKGLAVALELVTAGENAKENGVLGSALVRAGVAGTGHQPMPVEAYLVVQERKKTADQGHRTAARGLRELYRLMGLIDDSGDELFLTDLGEQAASFADRALDDEQKSFWRSALTRMSHDDAHGQSHPYQVLLRLVGRQREISRAKCALALEARDDSPEELDRISGLAALDEADIRQQIRVSKSNWDNAKKMLPRFAEQLGDVIKTGSTYVLADAPSVLAPMREDSVATLSREPGPARRAPRSARQVTSDTIGQAGVAERSEPIVPPNQDQQRMMAGIAARADRLRRHNLMVKRLARRLTAVGVELYEDPFDILAVLERAAILVEIKTLDGSEADERDRVRDALAQLLYYEAFVTQPLAEGCAIYKVACFESRPSDAHIGWLKGQGISAAWADGDRFVSDHDVAQWFDV